MKHIGFYQIAVAKENMIEFGIQRLAERKNKNKMQKQNKERGSVAHEFFNMFFGETEKAPMKENKNIPAKGENIETEINVKLEDAYYGAEKRSH